MRKIFFAVIALTLTVSCKQTKATTEATADSLTTAQQLIHRLDTLQGKGIMFGHQDDPFYGLTWEWDENRSDTKELVGEYPAVMGFDLGGIEMGDAKNLDSVPFNRIRQEAINHYERGGIITFSWHPRNPRTGGNAWDVSDTTVVRNILAGGEQYEKFVGWTDSVANFLLTLKDKDDQPIPFIFRPWHEYNGSWFWWGLNLCSDKEFLDLWCTFQDSINAKLNGNVVWSFSPNLYGGWNEQDFLRRYPGDDRVDVLGQDCYQWGEEADFIQQNTADVTFLSQFAKQHNLLFAITECGMKNSPVADWWSRVFLPTIAEAQPLYFLPWRNAAVEHFGPSKETTTADDFKRLADDNKILLLNDIAK